MSTAIVTGARGIGFWVGAGLARAGYEVVFAVRSPEVGEKACAEMARLVPDGVASARLLDLADLASVRTFAEGVSVTHNSLELLVNNAGVVMVPHRQETRDGFELHMGTNHLGHFALTAHLMPLLRAATAPRVVTVGSLAHRSARLDLEDLQSEHSYRPATAYGRSKLANLLFMTGLARRSEAEGWGILSAGAHPGFARTEAILHPGDSRLKRAYIDLVWGLVPSAEGAARSILHAATAPDVAPASYFGPGGIGEIAGRVKPARLAARARDADLGDRLWDLSQQLTGASW